MDVCYDVTKPHSVKNPHIHLPYLSTKKKSSKTCSEVPGGGGGGGGWDIGGIWILMGSYDG